LSAEKKKSKIKSGQGPQREARYPDELLHCLSAARRTPTPEATGKFCVDENILRKGATNFLLYRRVRKLNKLIYLNPVSSLRTI
jgi:hypothetical protein